MNKFNYKIIKYEFAIYFRQHRLTTGVFIPINEWNELKNKFKGIEQEEIEVPEWHKEIVRNRMNEYKNNPNIALDFDSAMDDIEKGL